MKENNDSKLHPHLDSAETDGKSTEIILGQHTYRLINPDGTFNIIRKGANVTSIYEMILGMRWTRFLLFLMLFYVIVNSLFAIGFMAIGADSIEGIEFGTPLQNFFQCLFFSIQTFTTVGYGEMSPNGNAANFLASVVAFVGLITFAIATGAFFAKFSKPHASILFSSKIMIAPDHKGKKSLQFRIVNESPNQLFDAQATVTLAWIEEVDGINRRKFTRLDLQIEKIHLFPLNWTIVHPLDELSPLTNLTKQEMIDRKMEVLILIRAFDDDYSQVVHAKRSYTFDDLLEGAKFSPMYEHLHDKTVLHIDKLDNYEVHDFQ